MLGQPGFIGIDHGNKARILHSLTVGVGHGGKPFLRKAVGKHGADLQVIGHRIFKLIGLNLLYGKLGLCQGIVHIFRGGAKVGSHLNTGLLGALYVLIEIGVFLGAVGDTNHDKIQSILLRRIPVNGTVFILELGNLGSLLQIL